MALSLALLLVPAHSEATAFAGPPPDVDALTCQAVRAQQLIERRWREFEFRTRETTYKLSGGEVTERKSKTRRVHRSRPDGIEVSELLVRDGVPLAAGDRERSEREAGERLAELRDDPRALGRAIAARDEDSDSKYELLGSVRDGFELELLGLDWIGDVPCWVVGFRPRPGFSGETRAERNLEKFRGVAWIQADDPVLRLLELDFIDSFSVKFGALATLTAGSHLRLEQREVAPGVTMTDTLTLDLHLRILFLFRKSERRVKEYRDFVRVNRPVAEP